MRASHEIPVTMTGRKRRLSETVRERSGMIWRLGVRILLVGVLIPLDLRAIRLVLVLDLKVILLELVFLEPATIPLNRSLELDEEDLKKWRMYDGMMRLCI